MNLGLKDWGIGTSIAVVIWLILPDILTRTEAAVLIFSLGWICAWVCSDIRDFFKNLKERRDQLRIRRKPDHRSGKVIDFTPKRKKHLWFVSTGTDRETIVMM